MKRKLPALLLTVVLLAACGAKDLLQAFRGALAMYDPLVNSLVASGAISPTFAGTLRTDFSNGVGCGDKLYTDFKAIPKNDPDAKRKKLSASVSGARCFKFIVDRQNFAKTEQTKRISEIAEGILASMVVFYSEPGEIRADVSRSRTVTASDEKELERKLKAQIDELKAAMKPL
jgi:hypothetical protein